MTLQLEFVQCLFLPNRKQNALYGCDTLQEVFVSDATNREKALLPVFEPLDI